MKGNISFFYSTIEFVLLQVFENDMNAEREAQAVILLLPAGKSAHIEAGVAYGMGKECILIGEQKKAVSYFRQALR